MELFWEPKGGGVFELTAVAGDVKWFSSAAGQAGYVEFEMMKGAADLRTGDGIRLALSGADRFLGRVFTLTAGPDRVKVRAYDQLRYLLQKYSYTFTGVTASAMLRAMARDFRLAVGTVADTGYVFPKFAADGQSLLDMMLSALRETRENTGRLFVLGDAAGRLTLTDCRDRIRPFALSAAHNLTDYSDVHTIDESAYTKFEISRTLGSGREVRTLVNGPAMDRFGVLLWTGSATSGESAGVMDSRLRQAERRYAREHRSFSCEGAGEDVTAGDVVAVMVAGETRPYLIASVRHTFAGGARHTMKLELERFV